MSRETRWPVYRLGRNLGTIEVVKANTANIYGWNLINDEGADRFVALYDDAVIIDVLCVPGGVNADTDPIAGVNQVWPARECAIYPIQGAFSVRVFDDADCATPSGADDILLTFFLS